MAKYTVRDDTTGKMITFNWTGSEPPTEADFKEIFAEAKKMSSEQEMSPQLRERISKFAKRAPEALETAAQTMAGGVAGPIKQASLGAVAPENQPALKRAAATVSPVARPVLEMGGALTGAALTSPGNIPAPGLASAAGAGLGFAAGRKLADALDVYAGKKEAPTLKESLIGTAKDIPVGMAMELGGPILGKIGGGIAKTVIPEKVLERVIDKGINKAIRPSVSGKGTASQLAKHKESSREAVKAIIRNKENLNLTDEVGRKVNKLPETLEEFSQAIENTKRNIFRQYDQVAKAAERASEIKGPISIEPGMRVFKSDQVVNLNKIADELEPLLKKKAITDFYPDLANYAVKRIAALRNSNFYTAEEAQEAIKLFNDSLKSFYKNPTFEGAGKASIDAAIANNMRKALDEAIEKASGPGYQGLKNQYGALKSIEKDVAHRAVVDARKNIKGLLDFSDLFSGHEVARGILTMSPASVASGVAVKGMSSFYKHLNNPNRLVKSMFSEAEKLMAPATKTTRPAGPVERVLAYESLNGPEEAEAAEPLDQKGNTQMPIQNNNNQDPIDALTPNMAMSTPTAKAGVQAYLDQDYNSAISHFRKALMENPEKSKEYRTAINQAMKEQKELGKYGILGPQAAQAKTTQLPIANQPPMVRGQEEGQGGKLAKLARMVPKIGLPQSSAFAEEMLPTEVQPSVEEQTVPLEMTTAPEENYLKMNAERYAVQSYQDGDYKSAIEGFKQAMIDNPEKADEYQDAINQILIEMENLKQFKLRNMFSPRVRGFSVEDTLGEGI